MTRRAAALLLAALVVTGCSSGEPDREAQRQAPDEPAATVSEEELEDGDVADTDLPLEEVGDSGISGTARVGPAEGGGDALLIEVEVDGEGVRATHGIAARIGSCAEAIDVDAAGDLLEGATSYTLADIVDGRMRDEATLPQELVAAGTYALVVYAGEEVEGEVAACAEVAVE